MSETIYDRNVQYYLDFLDSVLSAEPSIFKVLLATLEEVVAGRQVDADVLDVACGEGYVTRHFAERGARRVVGVDLSSELIDVARERTTDPNATFVVDDARELGSQPDDAFDLVVSQMAMMDIADHVATFRAVKRVLKPGGTFAFTMLHPCMQAPCEHPEKPAFLDDAEGNRIAVLVWKYKTEGQWFSGSTGVRGTMGSHHRTISTYINDLIATGFEIERVEEPVAPNGTSSLFEEVPLFLVIGARLEP